MNIYGVYDLNDKEQCICIGSSEKICNFLEIKKTRLYEIVNKKLKFKYRYEIIKLITNYKK